MTLEWGNIIFGVVALILASLASYYGQPLIHENEQAMNIIVTVFSILAGFLVAIITIVGDPVLLPPGTWRAAEMERSKLNSRLIRHKLLFTLYLITLALVFFAFLLKGKYPSFVIVIERFFLFFGVLAFSLSMALPSSLIKIQKERIDAIIEHRRVQDNIPKD